LNESYENTKKNFEILLDDSRIDLIILGHRILPGVSFIKLFPKIAFDIGIEYMKSKNITKQFVKKNRNQVVIEYKML
jgi:hypothetical protein